MMLSPADQRVVSYLRKRGKAGLSAIGAACFAMAGKPERSGIRPAAAHLARMEERRIVRRQGRYYLLQGEEPAESLFDLHEPH